MLAATATPISFFSNDQPTNSASPRPLREISLNHIRHIRHIRNPNQCISGKTQNVEGFTLNAKRQMLAAKASPCSFFSNRQPTNSASPRPMREISLNHIRHIRHIRIDHDTLTLRFPFFVPLYPLFPFCETFFKLHRESKSVHQWQNAEDFTLKAKRRMLSGQHQFLVPFSPLFYKLTLCLCVKIILNHIRHIRHIRKPNQCISGRTLSAKR